MERYALGEDFRWNLDRPVGHDDFNRMNDAGIFQGPLETMYPAVSMEGLKAILEQGEKFALVDVRGRREYEEGHISGSISIPVGDVEREAPSVLKKDDLIIVYSNGPECMASAVAADKLKTIGYDNILRFQGGFREWKEAGFALEGRARKVKPEPEHELEKAA